jgi:hypothetical protein
MASHEEHQYDHGHDQRDEAEERGNREVAEGGCTGHR